MLNCEINQQTMCESDYECLLCSHFSTDQLEMCAFEL